MILGVSITKSCNWRGIEEEFSNVYHFDTTVETTSDEVINGVVNAERQIYGDNVKFVKGQAWGPADGTQLQSQMLLQKPLTGFGALVTGAKTAQELTAVVSWDTGRVNTRGGRIFLRKYAHVGRIDTSLEDVAKGNTALPQNIKEQYESYGNSVKNAVGINRATLCDKQGRQLPLNTPATVLPHLHTRQFRR
jgi:hypothetical protein